MLDHAEVVRDEDIAAAELVLQVHEEIEDLRLDRDIERRYRLVSDDDRRIHDHGAGDRNALALAAREHMRVAAQMLAAQTDQGQQRFDAFPPFGLGQAGIDQQRLTQGRFDAGARVERGIRVLEHHLHLLAQGLQLCRVGNGGINALQQQRARAGRLDQRQLPCQGRFAAARLTDHRQRLAPLQGE